MRRATPASSDDDNDHGNDDFPLSEQPLSVCVIPTPASAGEVLMQYYKFSEAFCVVC